MDVLDAGSGFFEKGNMMGKCKRAMFGAVLAAVAGCSGHVCGVSGSRGTPATGNFL